MIELLPTIVGLAADLITSEPAVKEVLMQNAGKTVITAGTALGVVIELLLRKVKTKRRLSFFLAAEKFLNVTGAGLAIALDVHSVLVDALCYVNKKFDKLCKHRTKE